MAVIEVTGENFAEEVLNSDRPVLVDFNAGWCGPCKMLKPLLHEVAEEQDAVKVVSVDIDEEDELAEQFEVSAIPCLVLVKDGKEANRSVGFIPKDEILSFIGG